MPSITSGAVQAWSGFWLVNGSVVVHVTLVPSLSIVTS